MKRCFIGFLIAICVVPVWAEGFRVTNQSSDSVELISSDANPACVSTSERVSIEANESKTVMVDMRNCRFPQTEAKWAVRSQGVSVGSIGVGRASKDSPLEVMPKAMQPFTLIKVQDVPQIIVEKKSTLPRSVSSGWCSWTKMC